MDKDFYLNLGITDIDKGLIDTVMENFPEEAIVPVSGDPPYIDVKRPSVDYSPDAYHSGKITIDASSTRVVKFVPTSEMQVTYPGNHYICFTFNNREFTITGNVTLEQRVENE